MVLMAESSRRHQSRQALGGTMLVAIGKAVIDSTVGRNKFNDSAQGSLSDEIWGRIGILMERCLYLPRRRHLKGKEEVREEGGIRI